MMEKQFTANSLQLTVKTPLAVYCLMSNVDLLAGGQSR